jgi:hypothetical protein
VVLTRVVGLLGDAARWVCWVMQPGGWWCAERTCKALQRQPNSPISANGRTRTKQPGACAPGPVFPRADVVPCAQCSNMASSGQVDEQQRADLWRARRLRPAVESNFPRMSECAIRMNTHDPFCEQESLDVDSRRRSKSTGMCAVFRQQHVHWVFAERF